MKYIDIDGEEKLISNKVEFEYHRRNYKGEDPYGALVGLISPFVILYLYIQTWFQHFLFNFF
jgi:hypothetical protein